MDIENIKGNWSGSNIGRIGRTVDVYTDGGTKGHNKLGKTKEVSMGILIKEHTFISEIAEGKSNNEGEFMALIKAMQYCLDSGIRSAKFHLDSQIVQRRANGHKPRAKKHYNARMDNFQDKVLELAEQFDKVEFIWIPREQNRLADELSNKACNL